MRRLIVRVGTVFLLKVNDFPLQNIKHKDYLN